MKKLVYIILAGIFFFRSCKDQDKYYKEYVVIGGKTYPGIALDARANPGRNRIEIQWLNSADPTVKKARIYWNNFVDWVDLDIQPDADTIRHIIEELDENTYSFIIRTIDDKGNFSVPVEVIGNVFGEIYEGSLLNRTIRSSEYDDLTYNLTINWHNADASMTGMNLSYTNPEGNPLDIEIDDMSKTSTLLPDFNINHPLVYYTMHKPDSLAINTFFAREVEKRFTSSIDDDK